ncbi:hypothetical protein Ssi03_58470 [Sphaerisporangium siamense]|nr:hypothetical protein [Sphaerisporangium siamense]GII87857.1 hypothetical protein Ssi03_58470 [Sphaerisporangium siamense]
MVTATESNRPIIDLPLTVGLLPRPGEFLIAEALVAARREGHHDTEGAPE